MPARVSKVLGLFRAVQAAHRDFWQRPGSWREGRRRTESLID